MSLFNGHLKAQGFWGKKGTCKPPALTGSPTARPLRFMGASNGNGATANGGGDVKASMWSPTTTFLVLAGVTVGAVLLTSMLSPSRGD